MKKLLIHPAIDRPKTEVYVGSSLLKSDLIQPFCGRGTIILIADRAVKHYADDLAKRLGAQFLTIPSGEKIKTLQTAEHLINELLRLGAGRDATLIAVGGGVTTDLVGFVASIYMRGISLLLVPTTLLGMVDAAIGGKTAIDSPFGKNLIGSNYPPKAIFADLDTIETLPEKEWINGLSEIMKIGFIYDPAICDLAQKNRKDPELIFKAIKGKIAIVEQDPLEKGLRRILNFGHTIGHALEAISDFELAHGEAVAFGCVAEAHLSCQLGFLPPKEFERIQTMMGQDTSKLPKHYSRKRFLEAMSHDKKKAAGKIRFVLIDQIGHALSFEGQYCRAVTEEELTPTLDWMEKIYG